MKKSLLVLALLIGMVSFHNTIEAQVSVNVNINVGRQPAWGPVGYDYVDYYYFPDINCYFNVNLDLFYYFERGRWFSARYLPYRFHNYDLYGMYKVVLVGVADPWMNNSIHIRDYGRYKGYKNQVVIRDSRDVRYRDSRNNNIAWYSGNKSNNYRTAVSNNNRSSNNNDRRNVSTGNNNEKRSINANTNNERRSVNASTRQQKTDGINQPQRKSDGNQSVIGRDRSSNNTQKESTEVRSSSPTKTQGNNRVASSERSSKNSDRSSRRNKE